MIPAPQQNMKGKLMEKKNEKYWRDCIDQNIVDAVFTQNMFKSKTNCTIHLHPLELERLQEILTFDCSETIKITPSIRLKDKI